MARKILNIKLSTYDEEQIAVAMLLRPDFRTKADLVRAGIANVIELSASLEQRGMARRKVRKARELAMEVTK